MNKSHEFRTINAVTPEVEERAYEIVRAHNQSVNPDGHNIYDKDKINSFYCVSLTGNRRSYYTLYVHNNHCVSPNAKRFYYVCNLSTDLIEAVEKICTGKGKPVMLEVRDNFNPERIPGTHFPFGKYKGESLSDVYERDPKYVVWASYNMTSKKHTKSMDQFFQGLEYLRDAHFQMVTEENLETATSVYVGEIKQRMDLELRMTSKFKPEPDAWGNQENTRYKAEDPDGNHFRFYSGNDDLEVGETYNIRGTVTKHFELLGVKTTSINRVAVK